MILRTNFPSDDFHFTQYRAYASSAFTISHTIGGFEAHLLRRLRIECLSSFLILLPSRDIHHDSTNSLQQQASRRLPGVEESSSWRHGSVTPWLGANGLAQNPHFCPIASDSTFKRQFHGILSLSNDRNKSLHDPVSTRINRSYKAFCSICPKPLCPSGRWLVDHHFHAALNLSSELQSQRA